MWQGRQCGLSPLASHSEQTICSHLPGYIHSPAREARNPTVWKFSREEKDMNGVYSLTPIRYHEVICKCLPPIPRFSRHSKLALLAFIHSLAKVHIIFGRTADMHWCIACNMYLHQVQQNLQMCYLIEARILFPIPALIVFPENVPLLYLALLVRLQDRFSFLFTQITSRCQSMALHCFPMSRLFGSKVDSPR